MCMYIHMSTWRPRVSPSRCHVTPPSQTVPARAGHGSGGGLYRPQASLVRSQRTSAGVRCLMWRLTATAMPPAGRRTAVLEGGREAVGCITEQKLSQSNYVYTNTNTNTNTGCFTNNVTNSKRNISGNNTFISTKFSLYNRKIIPNNILNS